MKPIAMFVLGVVLASVLAVFVFNRKSAPEPMATSVVTPAPTPVPPTAENPAATPAPSQAAPAPARSGFHAVESKPASRQAHPAATPSKSAAPASSTPAPAPAEQPVAQSTTTTTPQVRGPPQTTISMPPAPDGSKNPIDTKPAAPARVPKTVTVPAGTLLTVRVDDGLSTERTHTGDSFRATLDQALVLDGAVIAEKGARVEGRVTDSDPGGRVKG